VGGEVGGGVRCFVSFLGGYGEWGGDRGKGEVTWGGKGWRLWAGGHGDGAGGG